MELLLTEELLIFKKEINNMKNVKLIKFRQLLLQYSFFQKIKNFKYKIVKVNSFFDDKNLLEDAEHISIEWNNEKKPKVGLVKDYENQYFVPLRASWPKFQRFLDYNQIPYEFYNIHHSNWFEEAKKYDIIIWHCGNDPSALHIARSKIYIIEKCLRKVCYPNYSEIWFYEDKIRQNYLLNFYNLPNVSTFISNNKKEAIEYALNSEYPIVSKISTCAGSLGVELIKNKKEAVKLINKVFAAGRKTYWIHQRQKDYIYFQKFLDDAEYDLRVIVVGNKLFGYYRMRPKNDFRASGAGIYVKKEIPEEALLTAKKVADSLKTRFLAVDMLRSEREQKYRIIETSIFIGIDTAEQLKVNDEPGSYNFINDKFEFSTGKYWVQELLLKEIVEEWKKMNKAIIN
jgi:glutathione synthase/RimK-type ligase-like ATP-grasp enzyme